MPRAALGGALQAKRDSGELPYLFMAGAALGGALQAKRDSGELPYIFTPRAALGEAMQAKRDSGELGARGLLGGFRFCICLLVTRYTCWPGPFPSTGCLFSTITPA